MKQDNSNIVPEVKSNNEVKTFTNTIILPMYNTECLMKNINYNISPKTTKLPNIFILFSLPKLNKLMAIGL